MFPDTGQESVDTPVSEWSPDENDELVIRIWNGIQQAQSKYITGCGRLTETRTSRLLASPLVFKGNFCASGKDKFFLQYTDPEPIRLVFDRDYVNVTTGTQKKRTDVFKLGSEISKAQKYFSDMNSISNLKKDFDIQPEELPEHFELTFIPKSRRFKQRTNYIKVTLRKKDFLLSKLEIDGKSGVNSVFTVVIDSLNKEIDEDIFHVYRPLE